MNAIARRVVVYRNQMIFECTMTRESWLCGACGLGDLTPDPRVAGRCPQCGARVEEVL